MAAVSGLLISALVASLAVGSNGTFTVLPTISQATNTAGELRISDNGKLDLANQSLLTLSSPASVRSYLASALGVQKDWSGPGLTSSMAASDPVQYTIGYSVGADQSAQDAGLGVAVGQTLVVPTLTGDANLDGKVDFFDIAQVLGYRFNAGGTGASYTDRDLHYDC